LRRFFFYFAVMPVVSISEAKSDVWLSGCAFSVKSTGFYKVPAIFMFSFLMASLY